MKKMDTAKPSSNDGLNLAGALKEIRELKAVVNSIIEEVEGLKLRGKK